MRFDPANQNMVAVDDQVVRGDRRAQIRLVGFDIVHAIATW